MQNANILCQLIADLFIHLIDLVKGSKVGKNV
jgi:hypothetical protein